MYNNSIIPCIKLLNGGALLHKTPWNKNCTFQSILDMNKAYVNTSARHGILIVYSMVMDQVPKITATASVHHSRGCK